MKKSPEPKTNQGYKNEVKPTRTPWNTISKNENKASKQAKKQNKQTKTRVAKRKESKPLYSCVPRDPVDADFSSYNSSLEQLQAG